jgi:hypothetical protein
MQAAQKLPKHAPFRRVMNQCDRRRNKRIQDFFDRGTNFARFPFVFVETVQPFFIEWPQSAKHDGFEQSILGLEVIVNGGKIDVRGGNDGPKRRPRKTVVREHLLGDVEYALLGISHAHTTDSIIRLNESQGTEKDSGTEH